MSARLPWLFLLTAGALAACGGGGTSSTPDAAPDIVFLPPDAAPLDAAGAEDAAEEPDVVPVDVAVADAPALPAPLSAPADTWTWVQLPGLRCANGSPTGIGLNLHPGSNRVLLFLQGGGACWDGTTCWGPVSTSFYIATGYDQAAFATDVARGAMLPMRRNDPSNPFREYNLVYVPYCTGDVHAGNNVRTYTYLGRQLVTYHVGAANLDLLLPYVRATFPNPERFWLAGDSAGGFGSALNLPRVRTALPGVRVDVLDDSGQPIEPDATRWAQWRDAWNLQVPADCADCRNSVRALTDYVRVRYPDSRFALLSYNFDSVISTFMGLDALTFNARLEMARGSVDASWPNARYFIAPGALHVLLLTLPPGLVPWLQQLVNGDTLPASVHP